MQSDLDKLRIDKNHKSTGRERALWPWVLIGIVLLIVVIVFLAKMASRPPVVQTQVVKVPEGAVLESDLVRLTATGYIMAAHKIELASKVIGRVAWVGVEMGDKIKKGQELVGLEDDEYRARVMQEEGQLDAAKARLAELKAGSRAQEIAGSQARVLQAEVELENAALNATRMRELEASRSVSRQQIEDADALMRSRQAQLELAKQDLELVKAGPRKEQIDAAEATVRQLEGVLKLAMVDIGNTVIRSHIDATVLERNVDVGEFVTTGFVGDRGAKGYVVSIADLNDLRVELDISQSDFAKVTPGAPCWITTDAYPDRKYEGVVDLISPEANRQKATVQVRVRVLNPDELLKPDMNATVNFLAADKLALSQAAATQPVTNRPVLRIPATVVNEGMVFVVEDGKAMSRTLVLGEKDSTDQIEVKNGLLDGDLLILNAPAGLKDGDPIQTEGAAN